MNSDTAKTRIETDYLGAMTVEAGYLYGVHTMRGV